MPRLLTRDAHEWIIEIPTVPNFELTDLSRVAGKEDPVEFDFKQVTWEV